MIPPETLQVFRHAAPVTSGICYGRSDVSVQVPPQEAAETIARQVQSRPEIVWTSPSERCLAPATLLAHRWGVALEVDHQLLELNFGAWEGVPWSDLAGRHEFETWAAEWMDRAPPNGERVAELEARVHTWWDTAISRGPALLVGHAGVIRALRVLLHGCPWPEAMAAPVPHLAPGW